MVAAATPTHRRSRWGVVVVTVVTSLLLVAALPAGASWRHRSAVEQLHAQLAVVLPPGATVVHSAVVPCRDGVAPASVTRLRSDGDATGREIAADVDRAFEGLGFVQQGVVGDRLVAARERADDLDADLVSVAVVATDRVEVVVDVADTDGVVCWP